ncbi:methionine--tRNA ligase [Alphaproteobacteria bacterium endosymbiont of Tiliacea citrago]|uniref:methionine--tRNA ligase n=1 Tax=Alphaproteobacteria bacterium endosymbiont of Tiliacea citrago TaxID=3077944 RepID=UPI00313BCC64
MNKVKYLTAPIFYANSTPHIGHLYTGLVCDLWKQINLVMGEDFFLSSGMDEHGQKVFQVAVNNGLNPKVHVDNISESFKKFFEKYNVRYDYWVRTTDEQHKKATQIFWNKLKENGYVYKHRYKGWYSISDESYLDVSEDYVSTSKNIVWREEECYYFKLSSFQEKLVEYYEKHPETIYPKIRYNEAMGFIKQGLKDFSISRPKERLSWGIEVPDDPDQVMYVWIDALANYLTLIGYPDQKYLNYWPATHVVGKDILKFHAIYWPALLMAADLLPPKKVVVHGWWLNGDQKVSKSLNNAIDIDGLTEVYGSDAIRYFLLSNMTLGEDANFKESLFHSTINAALSNKYGNILLRLLGIAENKNIKELKHCELDEFLNNVVNNTKNEANNFVKNISFFDQYIRSFSAAFDSLNNYISENTIWKQEGEQLNNSLYSLLYCFKVLSVLFSPILPECAKKIAKYFDVDLNFKDVSVHKNIIIKEPIVLFPRVME